MAPRPRRRAPPQAEPEPDFGADDEYDFESDPDGTVDLGGFDQGEDFDFEAEAAAPDDYDFESDIDGGGAVAFAEDQDYDDEDFEAEAAPARRSRRGAAADDRAASRSARNRSSRRDRVSSASERKKAAKSSRRAARRELSEEEIEARRAARKSGIMLTLLMLVILGGGFAFYWFVMRTDPARAEAIRHLQTARQELQTLDQTIATGDDKAALEILERVLEEHLVLPQFAMASTPTPDPENPNIVSVPLAAQAYQLHQEFNNRRPAIREIEESRQAKLNFDVLVGRFATLDEEEDLNALSAAARAFIDNPVYPDKGPNIVLANRFRNNYVSSIRQKLVEIDRERARRLSAATTDVVADTNRETDSLLKLSQYGEALRLVDEMARRNPEANLRPVRQKIEDAAKAAWSAARSSARREYQIWTDPGSSPTDRQQAKSKAQELLRDVINRFGEGVPGVDQYVQEARRLQSEWGL